MCRLGNANRKRTMNYEKFEQAFSAQLKSASSGPPVALNCFDQCPRTFEHVVKFPTNGQLVSHARGLNC